MKPAIMRRRRGGGGLPGRGAAPGGMRPGRGRSCGRAFPAFRWTSPRTHDRRGRPERTVPCPSRRSAAPSGSACADALPFLLVIVPFGLLFGVAGERGGLAAASRSLAMSAVVIAGASQFTALQLLTEHAPLVIAIATPLAVNLQDGDVFRLARAATSARAPRWQRALVAYALTDQTYGVAMNRYALSAEAEPAREGRPLLRRRWCRSACPGRLATWAGAVAGRRRSRRGWRSTSRCRSPSSRSSRRRCATWPHVAAAVVSVVVALALAWMPYNLVADLSRPGAAMADRRAGRAAAGAARR